MSQVNRIARGRPPASSPERIGQVALALFVDRGFEQTTMDDVAAAVGVGRRTLFRYFASKNDLVWGDFNGVLQRLRREFDAADPDAPLLDVLREAVITSNTYPLDQLDGLRQRMTLIITVPALQAHSMLRYAEWREVVAAFAASRLERDRQDLAVRAIAAAALAASMTAFTYWIAHPDEDVTQLLDRSYRLMAGSYDATALPS